MVVSVFLAAKEEEDKRTSLKGIKLNTTPGKRAHNLYVPVARVVETVRDQNIQSMSEYLSQSLDVDSEVVSALNSFIALEEIVYIEKVNGLLSLDTDLSLMSLESGNLVTSLAANM